MVGPLLDLIALGYFGDFVKIRGSGMIKIVKFVLWLLCLFLVLVVLGSVFGVYQNGWDDWFFRKYGPLGWLALVSIAFISMFLEVFERIDEVHHEIVGEGYLGGINRRLKRVEKLLEDSEKTTEGR